MLSQILVAVPSLGMTLGVVYICGTIAAMQVGSVSVFLFTNHHSSLFGITYTQVAKYYKKYPDDWWIFRYSVCQTSDQSLIDLAHSLGRHTVVRTSPSYDKSYRRSR